MIQGTLSAADELGLIRLAKAGDQGAVGRLLEAAGRWIEPIARRYANARIEDDDLSQVGALELLKAIRRFDLSAGVRLRTYAEPSVRAGIQRVSRMQQLVSMSVRDATLMARIVATRARLVHELGREPTQDEVAREVGIEDWQLGELARLAEGVLDLSDLPEEELADSALRDAADGGELYTEQEVEVLVAEYPDLRARVAGSRQEIRADAQTTARRPGTSIHLRLLDLERALDRLPQPEFDVLQSVGLNRRGKAETAKALGVAERTVYNRWTKAIRWLTEYMNRPDARPPLRDFGFALDPDPMHSLAECVRRHRQVFERLIKRAECEPNLAELRVTWIPAKNACVPVLVAQGQSVSAPLVELLQFAA